MLRTNKEEAVTVKRRGIGDCFLPWSKKCSFRSKLQEHRQICVNESDKLVPSRTFDDSLRFI